MGENSQKIQCQTCFAVFDKHQSLRDHVDAYQREAHALMARLREVQAHLPPLDEQNQACHGSLNEDDRDFDDNDDEDTDRDDIADLDGLICPYPICDRKEAFKTKQAQIRHYETHVACYEICVFCRDSFVQVRKYIAHMCKAKATSYEQWRDQYRKERCTQLHRQAAEKLDEMLDLDSKAPRKEDSRKRARDAEAKCADQEHTHKRLRTAYSVSDGHEYPEQSSLFASMHPTPLPTISSQLENCLVSSTHICGAEPPPGTDYSLLEGQFGLLPGRIQAPIFHSATIPPWYGLEQQLQPVSFENGLQSSHAFLPSSGDSYESAS